MAEGKADARDPCIVLSISYRQLQKPAGCPTDSVASITIGNKLISVAQFQCERLQ
jgi:hypothetical protein